MSEQATNRRAAEACGDGILGFYLRESRIVDRIVEQALKEALSTPIDGEMDMYAGDYVRQLEQTIREQAAALARAVAEKDAHIKYLEQCIADNADVAILRHELARARSEEWERCSLHYEQFRSAGRPPAPAPAKETTT